jgi:hypothetical protein
VEGVSFSLIWVEILKAIKGISIGDVGVEMGLYELRIEFSLESDSLNTMIKFKCRQCIDGMSILIFHTNYR